MSFGTILPKRPSKPTKITSKITLSLIFSFSIVFYLFKCVGSSSWCSAESPFSLMFVVVFVVVCQNPVSKSGVTTPGGGGTPEFDMSKSGVWPPASGRRD